MLYTTITLRKNKKDSMKKNILLIMTLSTSLLISALSHNTPLPSIEQKPIHFVHALEQFKISNNQTLFDHHKAHLKHCYTSSAYEEDVHSACTAALDYFATLPVTDKSLVILDIDDSAIFIMPTAIVNI